MVGVESPCSRPHHTLREDGYSEEAIVSDVAVLVEARDDVSRAGIVRMLRAGGLRVVEHPERGSTPVTVLAVPVLDGAVLGRLRSARHESRTGRRSRHVVVTDAIDVSNPLQLAECGVFGVVSRTNATTRRLAAAVRTVAVGGAFLPTRLQGTLLTRLHVVRRETLEPHGFTLAGLHSRERDVLGLIAEGFDTAEIATKLSYSQRTVKNIISGLKHRLRFRTRNQAMAFAIRSGAI